MSEETERVLTVVEAADRADGRLSLLGPLAAAAPPDRTGSPRMPVPEGWTELKVAGSHQTLLMELSEPRGVSLAQVRVSRQSPDEITDGGVEELRPGADSLVLAVERWSSGHWSGVHSAWLRTARGGTVLHRLWELPVAGGGMVDVAAQYPPDLARHLDHRVDTMVAGLGPLTDAGEPAGPDAAEDLYRDRRARRQVPEPLPGGLDLGTSGLPWLAALGTQSRGRLEVAPAAPPEEIRRAGLAREDGQTADTADHLYRLMHAPEAVLDLHRTDDLGPRFGARFWIGTQTVMVVVPAGPRADRTPGLRMALYPRRDLAEMVLRAAGHVAEGPGAAPRASLTWDQMTGAEAIPEGAVGTDPWPTGERHLWQLVALDAEQVHVDGPGRPDPGDGVLQVLGVADVGHFLARRESEGEEPPTGYRLQPVSGLALYQSVRDALRRSTSTE